MPKKSEKSREESAAENFFNVDEKTKTATEKKFNENISKEDFLKRTTEKKVKQTPKEEVIRGAIEKTYKKINKKDLEKVEKTEEKKTNSKNSKTEIKKSKLKSSGYELIITEKPQAAMKIANALGKSTQKNFNKVPYYEVIRDGKKIIVACAVGHLFTLKQNSSGTKVPTFDIKWIPNYLARKKDFTKRYYDTISKLTKEASKIIVATDYDIEGEVIGMNVVRYICGQEDASRMKFSTLTKDELNKAYEEKENSLNWGQAIAGETRHYLDWFYGINLSRALMNAIKTTGRFKIMSIGRVQGPALNLIIQKEREIQKFKSEPYWQVFITVSDGKNKLVLVYNKDIFDKKELSKFEKLKGQTANAETKKSQEKLPPNPPFNLTTLQTEAYKFYGITPSRTLQIAQSLYLAGLISYPRTSSQKLPDSIDYKKILKEIAKDFKAEKLLKREKPVEGEKTDSAHPSIYPTGAKQMLSGEDEKIYNLIAKRFISLFCEDAIINNKTIRATINSGEVFSTRGMSIERKGWLEVYPSKMKENQIPDMEGEVKIVDSNIEEKETQPPKRFSPASIVSELEKRNLGTKSTRAMILETLYDRGYIKGTSVEATPLGMSLIKSLEKYSPIIIDEKLTQDFEDEMEKISESKGDFESKEKKVIDKAKETITKIAGDLEKHQEKVGSELIEANDEYIEQQREENKLNKCPECKNGNLKITYSPKNKRHFIACDAYPNCKKTYSLPPNGTIKKIDKVCSECGFPMLMRLMKGKKPWIFCFNTECPTKKEKIEKYNPETDN